MDNKEINNDLGFSFNDDGLRLTDEDIAPVRSGVKAATAGKRSQAGSSTSDTDGSVSRRTEAQSKEEMARMIARNMAASMGGAEDDVFSGHGGSTAEGTAVKTAAKRDAPEPRKAGTSGGTGKKKSGKKKKKKGSAAKKAAVILTVSVLLLIAAGGGLYLTGLKTYRDVFLDNTYINGINVSGKTQSEAFELVKAQSTIPDKIVIAKKSGDEVTIRLEDIGYKDNTKKLISEYYASQDHYYWISSKFHNTEFKFTSSFKYDKKLLEDIVKRKIVDADMTVEPQDAYITQADANSPYTVVAEVAGDKVDTDKVQVLYNYIENALDNEQFEMSVSRVDCYETADVTAEDLTEACDRLNDLASLEIVFDFTYTTETLTGADVKDWVKFDEDAPLSGYTVDKDKAMAYVDELAEKYDTFGKDRQFKTTNRGTITIPEGSGCYGWWIDKEKTRDLICRLISEGESVETEPIYYVNPDSQYSYTCDPEWRTADKDYGNTYFEVDLSAQHMWYYENGEVKMESDIVSGYPSESRNTPGGVYKLWIKERGKTLRGSSDGHSYASYVEYWNNISTISIGFHDASWQNGVFGGEKYKSSTWGSHGCINMPFDKAKYIYENCDEGTPVFAYWS